MIVNSKLFDYKEKEEMEEKEFFDGKKKKKGKYIFYIKYNIIFFIKFA